MPGKGRNHSHTDNLHGRWLLLASLFCTVEHSPPCHAPVRKRRMLLRWRATARAMLRESPHRLRRPQACRRKLVAVAVTVLLVQSVEHPASPDCLQLLMFMFVRAARHAAPMIAAAKKMRRRAAAAKTFGGGDRSATTGGSITDSTVLLESWFVCLFVGSRTPEAVEALPY